MTIEQLKSFLMWCSVFNVTLLFIWWLFIAFFQKWVYSLHSKWFKMSFEQFLAIHYAAIMGYKMFIFVINIVPLVALYFISCPCRGA